MYLNNLGLMFVFLADQTLRVSKTLGVFSCLTFLPLSAILLSARAQMRTQRSCITGRSELDEGDAKMAIVSERIERYISVLEPEGDINAKIERLVTNEWIRRLNRYELINRRLERKYGMIFADFREREVVKERDYSFEVESDFWDWEMALDGIETVQEMLTDLKGGSNEA